MIPKENDWHCRKVHHDPEIRWKEMNSFVHHLCKTEGSLETDWKTHQRKSCHSLVHSEPRSQMSTCTWVSSPLNHSSLRWLKHCRRKNGNRGQSLGRCSRSCFCLCFWFWLRTAMLGLWRRLRSWLGSMWICTLVSMNTTGRQLMKDTRSFGFLFSCEGSSLSLSFCFWRPFHFSLLRKSFRVGRCCICSGRFWRRCFSSRCSSLWFRNVWCLLLWGLERLFNWLRIQILSFFNQKFLKTSPKIIKISHGRWLWRSLHFINDTFQATNRSKLVEKKLSHHSLRRPFMARNWVQDTHDLRWKLLKVGNCIAIQLNLKERLRCQERTANSVHIKMPWNHVQDSSSPRSGTWSCARLNVALNLELKLWRALQATNQLWSQPTIKSWNHTWGILAVWFRSPTTNAS